MRTRSIERRPSLDTIPRVSAQPITDLPNDHLLVALATIAASGVGLTGRWVALVDSPPLKRYRDILRKLHADTRRPNVNRRTTAGRDHVQFLLDCALADLAAEVTDADRADGLLHERVIAHVLSQPTAGQIPT